MSPDILLDDSLLHSNLSSINSNVSLPINCFLSTPSSLIFTTFMITNVFFLLPLGIFIFYRGIQQWWHKRSASSPATMRHSDAFTYHVVILMLIGVLGCIISCSGIYGVQSNTSEVGFTIYVFTCFGDILFHILTCLERYLAVVHPIIYLSLRNKKGIMIRNIIIGCVWLLSFGWTGFMMIPELFVSLNFAVMFLSVIVISFCSLSVLCILIRPGPGEQGVNGERVDQSKQRAFYTMVVILGILLLRFAWNLFWGLLYVSSEGHNCVAAACSLWFNLPCTLVLPVLFLQKGGTCVCFKNNIQ